MASFDAFFPTLLKHEGGFVDDPVDRGGATNKGITMKTFQTCARQYLNTDPTLDNLKALTDAQAAKIYKSMYWDKVRGDDIALQRRQLLRQPLEGSVHIRAHNEQDGPGLDLRQGPDGKLQSF